MSLPFAVAKECGFNPLHVSCGRGDLAEVQSLLSNPDTDINSLSACHNTALHRAVYFKHVKIVELLLSSPKIDVNIANSSGNTALHVACMVHASPYVIKALIHNGADPTLANKKRLIAREVAELYDNKEDIMRCFATLGIDPSASSSASSSRTSSFSTNAVDSNGTGGSNFVMDTAINTSETPTNYEMRKQRSNTGGSNKSHNSTTFKFKKASIKSNDEDRNPSYSNNGSNNSNNISNTNNNNNLSNLNNPGSSGSNSAHHSPFSSPVSRKKRESKLESSTLRAPKERKRSSDKKNYTLKNNNGRSTSSGASSLPSSPVMEHVSKADKFEAFKSSMSSSNLVLGNSSSANEEPAKRKRRSIFISFFPNSDDSVSALSSGTAVVQGSSSSMDGNFRSTPNLSSNASSPTVPMSNKKKSKHRRLQVIIDDSHVVITVTKTEILEEVVKEALGVLGMFHVTSESASVYNICGQELNIQAKVQYFENDAIIIVVTKPIPFI